MKRMMAMLLMILILMMAETAFSEEKIKIGYMPIVMSLPTFESSTLIIGALLAGRIDADCCSGTPGYWFAEQNAAGQLKLFLTYGSSSLKIPSFVGQEGLPS